ncbi:MAG: glycosyltransferase family 4 protein [bacterium]
MKILLLCNKSPWPPREGGPLAMNMLVEGLLEAGHSVKVLAVNSFKYNIDPLSIPTEYRQRTGIELIDIDLKVKPLGAFLNLFTGRSYHIERFISATFSERVRDTLEKDEYDIVQLETLFMSPYIGTIRQFSRAKIVLRAHNIEHLIWKRVAEETGNPLKRWYLNHLSATLKKYEHSILPEFDGIAAITDTDAGYFREVLSRQSAVGSRKSEIRNRKSEIENRNSTRHSSLVIRHSNHSSLKSTITPVIDIPFGVNPMDYPYSPEQAEWPSLFTIGAMNWIPNQDGVRWFLHNVWLDVTRQFPGLKYYLAGREMPGWMKELKLPNVVVLGEVEDARDFINSKAIMIVPLFSGSGIRIKIIEGLASGKTIISTSLGAEGITCSNRENILVANLPCEFFEMISICVGDRQICDEIGKKGRELIRDQYDRSVIVKKLISFYQQLRD